MAEIRLDYQHDRHFPWGGAALLVLALGALLLTSAYYSELRSGAAVWEAKLARHEGDKPHRQDGAASERPTAVVEQEVKHANEVLRQLGLPWDGLFRAVESAGSKDVVLLALEPDMEKRLVKIGGEAKNIPAMLGYVTQLEEQEMFESVYVLNHQIQQQSQEKPVRFSLLATMRGLP